MRDGENFLDAREPALQPCPLLLEGDLLVDEEPRPRLVREGVDEVPEESDIGLPGLPEEDLGPVPAMYSRRMKSVSFRLPSFHQQVLQGRAQRMEEPHSL